MNLICGDDFFWGVISLLVYISTTSFWNQRMDYEPNQNSNSNLAPIRLFRKSVVLNYDIDGLMRIRILIMFV
jgi:hypothetical protein